MTSKTTDTDGKCTFSNILNGTYSLGVSKEGYTTLSDTVTISDSDVNKEISLNPNVISLIFTWDASIQSSLSSNNLIVRSGGGVVDYGDGTTETLSEGSVTLSHTYTDTSKNYNVTISNITSLGDGCFMHRPGLTSVTIGDNVTSLEAGCFLDCYGLTSVTIGDNVTSLGNECFRESVWLSSVTIGDSVTNLGVRCFYICSSLNSVKFGTSTPPTLGQQCFEVPSTCVMYVPTGCKEAYETVFTEAGYSFTVVEY